MVHDATCSIGTELAALRPAAVVLVGSDIDEVRLAMARHNIHRTSRCAAPTRCARSAGTPWCFSTRPGAAADSRRFDPRGYIPPLDDLLDVYRGRPAVVKCAPGIDFDAVRRLGFDGEIEVTSFGGSVREACLWSAPLAEPGVRRRATVLSRDEVAHRC